MKYNTTSFIVFSIALVMIIAVILMAVAGILRIVAEVERARRRIYGALLDPPPLFCWFQVRCGTRFPLSGCSFQGTWSSAVDQGGPLGSHEIDGYPGTGYKYKV